MCFWKSKKSKVLIAERNMVVYKIGNKANENTFVPYFIDSFKYLAGIKCQTFPEFGSNSMTEGYHGYINIIITSSAIPASVAVQKTLKINLWSVFTFQIMNLYIQVNLQYLKEQFTVSMNIMRLYLIR